MLRPYGGIDCRNGARGVSAVGRECEQECEVAGQPGKSRRGRGRYEKRCCAPFALFLTYKPNKTSPAKRYCAIRWPTTPTLHTKSPLLPGVKAKSTVSPGLRYILTSGENTLFPMLFAPVSIELGIYVGG
jgi:hypothetical protein